MRHFKGVLQTSQDDCGAACLASILKFHGKKIPLVDVKRELNYGKGGANLLGICTVAQKYQYEVESLKGTLPELLEGIRNKNISLPLIAHIKLDNGDGHFIIILQLKKKHISIFDPSSGTKKISYESFTKSWTGYIINLIKNDSWKNAKRNSKSFSLYVSKLFQQKILLLKTLIFSLFISLIAFIGARAYQIIIDNHIMGKQQISDTYDLFKVIMDNLSLLVVTLVILYIIQLGLNIGKGLFISKVGRALSNNFSQELYSRMLNLPFSFFTKIESGEILSRFQSVLELQELLVNSFLSVAIQTIASLTGGIILISISPRLFVITLLIVVAYVGLFAFFLPKIKESNKRFYSDYSEGITQFNQTLKGIGTIKLTNANGWFTKKFALPIEKASQNKFEIELYSTLLNSLVLFVEAVGILTILWQGSQQVIEGNLSLGSLIAFQSLMNFFISPIKSLILLQADIQNLSIIVNRLNDIFMYPIEHKSLLLFDKNEAKDDLNIVLENITYSEGYSAPILHDINLSINFGKHVGIIGPSGSGKSTLLKIISTLYKPTDGLMTIGSCFKSDHNDFTIRQQIAYVDQEPYIFTGSLRENLLIEHNDFEYIESVCEACGIYEIQKMGRSIFDVQLGENGANLSGGQKQKVGMARALLKKPKILLLDEATSNLDIFSEKKIYDFLQSFKGEMTIINISHNNIVKEVADLLIPLSEGTIQLKTDI